MFIRALALDQAESLAYVHSLYFHNSWSVKSWQTLIQSSCNQGITLWHDESLIGFLVWQEIFETWDILSFAILEKYRRLGWGQQLFNHLLKTAQQKNAKRIFLEVKNNNEAAINFYEKNGFKRVSLRKGYYSLSSDHSIDGLVFLHLLHE